MFELKPCDPALYRQQTRRSTLIVAVLFLALAMVLSSLAVTLFGEPGGDNFRFNVGGVLQQASFKIFVSILSNNYANVSMKYSKQFMYLG